MYTSVSPVGLHGKQGVGGVPAVRSRLHVRGEMASACRCLSAVLFAAFPLCVHCRASAYNGKRGRSQQGCCAKVVDGRPGQSHHTSSSVPVSAFRCVSTVLTARLLSPAVRSLTKRCCDTAFPTAFPTAFSTALSPSHRLLYRLFHHLSAAPHRPLTTIAIAGGRACPICRAEVAQVLRVYI